MLFDSVKLIYRIIETFFWGYLTIYAVYLVLSVTVGAISLHEQKQKNRHFNYLDSDFYIPISIIIPAYNEELTVLESVESLLTQKYTLYEIIVVSDGSTDNTNQILIDTFNMQKIERPVRRYISCTKEKEIYVTYDYKVPIKLVIKENTGKADSLNLGICISEYPYAKRDEDTERILQELGYRLFLGDNSFRSSRMNHYTIDIPNEFRNVLINRRIREHGISLGTYITASRRHDNNVGD